MDAANLELIHTSCPAAPPLGKPLFSSQLEQTAIRVYQIAICSDLSLKIWVESTHIYFPAVTPSLADCQGWFVLFLAMMFFLGGRGHRLLVAVGAQFAGRGQSVPSLISALPGKLAVRAECSFLKGGEESKLLTVSSLAEGLSQVGLPISFSSGRKCSLVKRAECDPRATVFTNKNKITTQHCNTTVHNLYNTYLTHNRLLTLYYAINCGLLFVFGCCLFIVILAN